MKKQVGKSDVFTKDSLKIIQDKMREYCINSFNRIYHLNYTLKLKEEGRVVLSFRVLKSGQFNNMRILLSSYKERLDKAALNALYDTKEFESFNESINKEFLDFELALEFKLN